MTPPFVTRSTPRTAARSYRFARERNLTAKSGSIFRNPAALANPSQTVREQIQECGNDAAELGALN
jgi:hypothetical protein